MKIDDKKFLAEWMGWENVKAPFEESWSKMNEVGESMLITFGLDSWNPDANHDQFKEVFNKLDERQLIGTVADELCNRLPLTFAKLILNSLPKVMETVLAVLRKEG